MKKKQDDEPLVSSWGLMKDAVSKDSEFEGFFTRATMFTLALIVLPFEAIKVGIEALGGEFKSGDNAPSDL